MTIPTTPELTPAEDQPWTKRQTLIVTALAFAIWLVYAYIGPGADYYGTFSEIVTHPERLAEVAIQPWILSPPWLGPIMAPFVSLPGRAGYIAFIAVGLVVTLLVTRLFGGKPVLMLLSAQMWWVLWWGQLEWMGVLALGLGWLGLRKGKWWLIFVALAFAAVKPQVSFAPVALIWFWSGKERWKSLAAFTLLVVASLFVWGPWPLWYLQGLRGFVGDQHYGIWNASLGLAALPLLIPALLLPLSREQRLIAITATSLLISPYMPFYSTILLLVFTLPWWAYLFALIGYFPTLIGTRLAWNSIVLLPIAVLIWLYLPVARGWWEARRAQRARLV